MTAIYLAGPDVSSRPDAEAHGETLRRSAPSSASWPHRSTTLPADIR